MPKRCELSEETFEISTHEAEFLEQIAPEYGGARFTIPLPKRSPKERCRARVIHRNEQHLFRATSAFSGRPLISVYPPEVRTPIVSREEWFSDVWDATTYGREPSSSRTVFQELEDIAKVVPRAATVTLNNENSEYTTGTGYCKNCYLINSSEHCEDCYYSKLLQSCKDVVDSSYCYNSELLYECFNVRNCYDCRWVYNSENVNNAWFSDNLRGCSHCFLCTNLVNQSHCFLNRQLSPDAYEAEIEAALQGDDALELLKKQFDALCLERFYRYAEVLNSENCSGDFIRNSKNCQDCYDVTDSEDCLYVQVGVQTKDLIDCSNMYIKPELCYQTLGTIGVYNCHFCLYVFHSSDLWYCEQCFSCKHCFACVGLRNKEYCILNRQYDPVSYEQTVARLIEKMSTSGEWGQFLPTAQSPFPYNVSLAQEYYPLEESEALERGYRWRQPELSEYQPATAELPRTLEDTPDSVCRETLACEVSGKNYRIQAGELRFYQKMELPLPRVCPDVRYQRRLSLRNPRQLWERECAATGELVRSPFAPGRKERILSEQAYHDALFDSP